MAGRPADTIVRLLMQRSAETPDAECLRFEGDTLRFREVAERAGRLATVLHERGVRPGERVAVMLPNGLDFPVAWLAVPLLDAIVVPVDVRYQGADLGHVLRHSGARFALVGPEQLPLVQQVQRECPALEGVAALGGEDGGPHSLSGALARAPVYRRDRDPAPDTPVTIQYTSGTTGLPKGCVLDHEYWITLARVIQEHARLGEGDVILTAQRQSYMDPSWNLVLALLAGVPLVVLPRFSASGFWKRVREHGVTFFYCLGTMPGYLLSQPPDPSADRDHRVRLVYCSGIPIPLHAAIEDRWGCAWRETYGTTELGAVLLVPPEESASVGTGSMGLPVRDCEVRIVGDDGLDVRQGWPGELLVRKRGTMQGYFDDPRATAAWRREGWAATGDLVVRTGDDRYRLVGRTRDMIRRAGENISAVEVESVLLEYPGVRAVACIPVADEARGEEVKAYVELADAAAGDVVPQALHAFLAARLARFKVPRYLEVVTSLPLTSSEKVAKAALIASRPDHRVGAWDADHGVWVRS